MNKTSVFFSPSVEPGGKIITLCIDGREALHFEVVAAFITTELWP